MIKNKLISIIIPVYNAACYLKRCLDSLAQQTSCQLQVILVNDASTDNTLQIVYAFKELAASLSNISDVHIISHQENKGVACSRNIGLDAARGEYIYFLDADDYLADHALDLLLQRAVAEGADLVGCDWNLCLKQSHRVIRQPRVQSSNQAIEFMARGVMRWNLWLFLIRRDLFERDNIRFIDGQNMGEDMLVIFKLFSCSKNISQIHEPLYYYNAINSESLTKTYLDKHRAEIQQNLYALECYLKKQKPHLYTDELLNYLKLNIKLPLLISSSYKQYEIWNNWLLTPTAYCTSNNVVSFRIKCLQYMAQKKQYWFLKLHYYLLVKLVYGIIYK